MTKISPYEGSSNKFCSLDISFAAIEFSFGEVSSSLNGIAY